MVRNLKILILENLTARTKIEELGVFKNMLAFAMTMFINDKYRNRVNITK